MIKGRLKNKNNTAKKNLEDLLWDKILKPVFFSFDPEYVHHLVVNLLRFTKPILKLRKQFYSFNKNEQKKLERNLFGIKFPNPVGLAAGFDKNAELIDQMSDLGFGFVEIGTVTPLAQEGNNDGADRVIQRVKKNKSIIVGGNIGKNKVTPNENAKYDYLTCLKKLYDHVDYFAINVSSPNTPNLRELQNTKKLEEILVPLLSENASRSKKPILIKISPDLNSSDIKNIVKLSLSLKLDGIICTNTTLKRDNLLSKESLTKQSGGLSGQPLNNRSNEIIRMVKKISNGKLPIIGVGGILKPSDAIEKLQAGASLVQVYTGFIYNGPSFAHKINNELLKTIN